MYVQPPTWTMCNNEEIFNDFVEIFFSSLGNFLSKKSLNLQPKKNTSKFLEEWKFAPKKKGWLVPTLEWFT